MPGLDENPLEGKRDSPNADIMEKLLSQDSMGDACIIIADGKTDVKVRSNTCTGIIDVRRPKGEPECDPEEDPNCKI
jgi:hypothetical protein